ncbi:hypothetical protein COO60DRAFT_1518042 [Scenedesmus sp. NREL 46B-D3]|nr:hypothetical protein COO60DRAFT_1518042 [Scenedesmus sp. NREL 46B-D3]
MLLTRTQTQGLCKCSKSHVARPQQALPAAAHRQAVLARDSNKTNWLKELFDFESWAPKSTKIWRLQQYQPPPAAGEEQDNSSDAPDALSILSDRINRIRDSPSGSSRSSSSGSAAIIDPPGQQPFSSDSSRGSSTRTSSGGLSLPGSSSGAGLDADPAKSFSDADDDELSAALGKRISQIATTSCSWSESMDEEAMRQPLTGEEIRGLLLSKYGKQYDLSFVKRDVPGMKTFICLNIMWLHLEQRSFKMSVEQYTEKLEGVAAMVNVLGQTDKVRAFLNAPAKSQKGLPRRPVVGTAISIRFDLDQAVIDEWFGRGYD